MTIRAFIIIFIIGPMITFGLTLALGLSWYGLIIAPFIGYPLGMLAAILDNADAT